MRIYDKCDQVGTEEEDLTCSIAVILKVFCFCFVLFCFVFLTTLGLHCCAQAFSSCGKRGLLFVVVRRLLIVVTSLVAEPGL